MPRPGPRPYECVRRAWHSERHQPIRGSLIQEIFRLANEVHNPATLRNKEWLEKLPLVVLKAEEIMYSKANSEAEYMDLNTLWDRTKDSIDTIIRRDDAPETGGDLLQPCIEAALNLGCIPRRASRSQRHNSPVFYLTSVNKDAHPLVSSAAHLLPPLPMPMPPPSPHSINRQSSLSRLELWYASILAANKPNHREAVNSAVPDGPLGEPNGSNPACGCPSLGRVYPLYYGDDQPKDGMGLLDDAKGALNAGLVFGDASKPATGGECDLSLRLGLFSPPSSESVSSSSCNGSKCSCPSSDGTRAVNFGTWKAKGFDFICVDSADEPLESFSSKWSSEEEGIATRHGF